MKKLLTLSLVAVSFMGLAMDDFQSEKRKKDLQKFIQHLPGKVRVVPEVVQKEEPIILTLIFSNLGVDQKHLLPFVMHPSADMKPAAIDPIEAAHVIVDFARSAKRLSDNAADNK